MELELSHAAMRIAASPVSYRADTGGVLRVITRSIMGHRNAAMDRKPIRGTRCHQHVYVGITVVTMNQEKVTIQMKVCVRVVRMGVEGVLRLCA